VRVSASDDNTDFYTVPLTQETLRHRGPCTPDPYGHVLMLVKRVPETNGAPASSSRRRGARGSVTRKRFWRGNFLFVHEPALGSPGFKRFRPIVREQNGALRRLTNAEIAKIRSTAIFRWSSRSSAARIFTIAWMT